MKVQSPAFKCNYVHDVVANSIEMSISGQSGITRKRLLALRNIFAAVVV
jgi:hypothetical protein